MTIDECLEFIHMTKWSGSKPGLSRTRELLDKLGNPQDSLKFVHVVGTNGKGSFCAMLAEILTDAGYNVGNFTSPYIEFFNERIKLGKNNIPDEDLCRLTEYVKPFAEEMADPPTEFEMITAIGFCYFKEKKCDIVVLEAGMGGALDSTNVINTPMVSVFMSIGLDHMAQLGNTVAEIAATKAGILKKGTEAVFYGEEAEAVEVIKQKCRELDIPLTVPDRDRLNIRASDLSGNCFDYKEFENIRTGLIGTNQIYNSLCVLETCKILRGKGFEISDETIRKGLLNVKWPARFEILHREPLIIYDGAHNINGINAFEKNLNQLFSGRKIDVIMGVMKDKSHLDMLKKIAPYINRMYAVTPNNPRSMKAEELCREAKSAGINAECVEIDEKLCAKILSEHEKEDIIICMGTLYMYSDIKSFREELRNDERKKSMKYINVALDGPSGAGKSTIAKAAAKELNLGYLDTGAMYRTIALFACRNIETLEDEIANGQISHESTVKIIALLPNSGFSVKYDENSEQHVFLGDEDVSKKIRTEKISMAASKVSAIPEVRVYLVEMQRKIGTENSIIMDGRDIGTHVLPKADVKLFLTAAPEARAKRRFDELVAKGQDVTYESVYEDILKRDYGDTHRETSPLRQAEDAILLDTTELSLEESVSTAIKIIREKTGR